MNYNLLMRMRVLTVYRNLIFIIRKLIGFVIGFGRFILFKKIRGSDLNRPWNGRFWSIA